MTELWNKELRDKIKAEIEEAMGKGAFDLRSVDAVEDRFGMRQRVAGEDAIRNFCNGIGDVNPLYRSRDYAKNSIHGSIIAPPHFLVAVRGLKTGVLGCWKQRLILQALSRCALTVKPVFLNSSIPGGTFLITSRNARAWIVPFVLGDRWNAGWVT